MTERWENLTTLKMIVACLRIYTFGNVREVRMEVVLKDGDIEVLLLESGRRG